MNVDEIYPKYEGKVLIPTKRASDELDNLGLDLDDATRILLEGFDCARSGRAENVVERCTQKGNKIIKIVAANVGNYWKIIHAGKFTISRKFRR